MKIELPDELIKRVKKHLRKQKLWQTVPSFIEEAVDLHLESYPWFAGDICVHSEKCMHHKSVEKWKEEADA